MDNRRKTIVINRKFQQQYAILVVVMTVILTNLFIIYLSLFSGGQPLELSSSEAWAIAIFELVLVVGVWYGSLRASHKVAGPVYKFTQQLKLVGSGQLWARIHLRKGDAFQEEAAAINASLDQLQARVEAVQNAADALTRAQAGGGDIAVPLAALGTELAALRTAREESA